MNHLNNQFGDMDIWLLDALLKGLLPDKGRVLDAGCGAGRQLIYFLRNGYDVLGVDLNDNEVRATNLMSRQLVGKEVAQKGDIHQLELPDGSIDLVICSRVLHFAADLQSMSQQIGELFRVMAPGGMLYLSFNSSFHYQLTGRKVAPVGHADWEKMSIGLERLLERQVIIPEENEETVFLAKRPSL